MMRKTIIALFAPVAVGLVQPTAASARGGGGGGHGGGFGGGGFHGGGFGGVVHALHPSLLRAFEHVVGSDVLLT